MAVKDSNKKCNGLSPHSFPWEGGAPRRPVSPVERTEIIGKFQLDSACNTKKGDRSLPEIK